MGIELINRFSQRLVGGRGRMEFCPKCGKVMVLKKRSEKVVLVCPRCGYEKSVKDKVIYTKVPRRKVEEITVIEEGEEGKVLPTTTDVICPKCGNRAAYYWSVQTRSADEPMTRFFRCTKCGYTWREYD